MVKINDVYFIDADMNNYTLKERKQIQDETSKNCGEYVFRDIGYYVSIEQCLKAVIKYDLRKFISKDDELSLKELQEKLNELNNTIKKLNLDI